MCVVQEGFLLLFLQALWYGDFDFHVQIALPAGLEVRHAFADDAESGTALRTGGDLELDLFVKGLDLDGAANTKVKDGETDYIVEEIKLIKSACGGHNLKVILETDLLTKEEIKYACECAVKGGADFVKTSTGFVKGGVGAKVEDVELMYNTVKDAGMKVKASGGIRDRETAIKMIEAGASRLGTSSGVKIVGV